MNLQDVNTDAIDAAMLESLKADAVSEGKTIDYKAVLPGRTDGEKIEFLADTSSFANTAGGHVLYGVVEQRGVPTGIPGLPGIDPDAEILRLESMLRDGVE